MIMCPLSLNFVAKLLIHDILVLGLDLFGQISRLRILESSGPVTVV